MTVTQITVNKGRTDRQDKGRARAVQYPRPTTPPKLSLERIAHIEAEIRTNEQLAVAYPEGHDYYAAENARLRAQLGGTQAQAQAA